jgi:Mrp family chromosome partitioning ATPase
MAVASVPTAGPAEAERNRPTHQVRTRTQPIKLALMREGGLLLPGCQPVAQAAMLRTQVMQRMKSRGWNTLAVLSAAPDEGKTFVATNLAIAIAADPDSTALLVDLDLRAPRLHRRFGFEPDVGVENCLRGEAELSAALVNPEGYGDLLLLPARGPVQHSSELLASSRAQLHREVGNAAPTAS